LENEKLGIPALDIDFTHDIEAGRYPRAFSFRKVGRLLFSSELGVVDRVTPARR
jgi:hypothetical protein